MSGQDLYLSPDQQDLLMAALNSNQSSTTQRSRKNTAPTRNNQQPDSLSFTPGSTSDQTAPGSGHLDFSDDSPYLDFNADGDFDNGYNFDDAGQMIGDIPDDGNSNDLHEKRKSIDGQDDDDEGGGKRREGDDKTAKKPGRKPLTSEPTNKRKAQNRAAQRAFRDRKEKHLRDLETKVEDLEKSSEAANQENGALKAEVQKLQTEVKEYRKRLSWMSNSIGRSNSINSHQQRSSLSGNDFQFEFPKFGDLPSTSNFSPSSTANQNRSVNRRVSDQAFVSASPAQAPAGRVSMSSAGPQANSMRNSPSNNTITASPPPIHQNSTDSLTGLFSPSILQAAQSRPLGYFQNPNLQASSNQRRSVDLSYGTTSGLTSNSSNTDSPGSNSDSQQHISSNGTSPETLFNSPGPRQELKLGAFGGDGNLLPGTFSTQNFTTDLNDSAGFDWLANQNGGDFDPVLFGDYRETQDNILSQDFGSFFNDAYPLPDLGSPLHNYGDVAAPVPDQPPKDDLMKTVDAVQDGEEVVPAEKGPMLTCNKIWDRLQRMEKFRNGEIDIDNLCSELRSKAKCSEGGAVVEEKHVNKILGIPH